MSGGRIARQPLVFIADQVLMMNPMLAPLWIGGFSWLLLSKRACTYRFVGWTFLGIFVPLLLLKAKNYYVSPAYPMLFAAGAVALEQATEGTTRWARSVYVAAVVLAGIVLAPFVLPILPISDYIHLYHGNASLLAESLEVIQQTSRVILAALEPPLEEGEEASTEAELAEVAA